MSDGRGVEEPDRIRWSSFRILSHDGVEGKGLSRERKAVTSVGVSCEDRQGTVELEEGSEKRTGISKKDAVAASGFQEVSFEGEAAALGRRVELAPN